MQENTICQPIQDGGMYKYTIWSVVHNMADACDCHTLVSVWTHENSTQGVNTRRHCISQLFEHKPQQEKITQRGISAQKRPSVLPFVCMRGLY